MQEIGSIITKHDLENYTAEWMEPVMIQTKNKERLYTAPPPGSGVLLGFIMNILDGFRFKSEHIQGVHNTVDTYHKIIEAFKYAYAKRTELGDMSFVNISEVSLLSVFFESAEEIRYSSLTRKVAQQLSRKMPGLGMLLCFRECYQVGL